MYSSPHFNWQPDIAGGLNGKFCCDFSERLMLTSAWRVGGNNASTCMHETWLLTSQEATWAKIWQMPIGSVAKPRLKILFRCLRISNNLPSKRIGTFGGIYYFALWPTNAQLFHKLSHSYVFRHYRIILRELVINTLPSYTSISNAAVGNTIYN